MPDQTTHPPLSSSSPASTAQKQDVSLLIFPPIVHTIWGMILLGGFALGMLMQVQSTEAWMLGSATHSFVPSMSLFGQFPAFWNHQLSQPMTIAFLVAWGVELTYITIKIGTARPQAHLLRKYGPGASNEHVTRSAQRRQAIWSVASWLIVLFNSFTDWHYASVLGGWQQVVFIGVLFVTTFYLGTLGVQNLTAGLSRMAS